MEPEPDGTLPSGSGTGAREEETAKVPSKDPKKKDDKKDEDLPRMLMTVDENLKPLSVPVHVGQAVDVVGQAGRPKTITGFQTHSTPVLLSAGDRAEFATEKYIPLSPILEGFVILKENPESREDN